MLPFLAALALAQIQAPARKPAPPAEPRTLHFAVIGDYGSGSADEAAVASLVAGWNPEIVVTVGDNNYPLGEASTIDDHIGQFYSAFIHPYTGAYGPGAAENRFFPSLGNHDWYTAGAVPYLAYFTLPGNERYYDFVRGPVHFFAIDSDPSEPDGVTSDSVQAQWLKSKLAASHAPFKVVYFHHPAYSSSTVHGSEIFLQWPYREWGADLVLAGHDHTYERIVRDGFPYFVCGLGGFSEYALSNAPVSGSAARFNGDFGAMVVDADSDAMSMSFVTRAGTVVDTFTLPAEPVDYPEVELIRAGMAWRYLDDGSNQGSAWRGIDFDDSAWKFGRAELGYGDGDESTVVSFGPDPNHRYVTTFFRRKFDVADPSAIRALSLELKRDDGAVVYLNGAEVWRTNMPAGAIFHTTLASSSLGVPEEDAFWSVDLPTSLLEAGTNQLAVEVHQGAANSSDLSFDLKLVGYLRGPVLSPAGATWSYLDTGVDPGPAWTSPAFDDSTWLAGPAQLGYGDADEATVVGYGPDAANKFRTTWFRRTFTVADPGAFRALLLRVLRDDGVAVYLNGTEIYRGNLPAVGLSSASLAGFDVAGADESAFFETIASAAPLLAGTNVLAVEVHQASAASPDLSFDLELLGL